MSIKNTRTIVTITATIFGVVVLCGAVTYAWTAPSASPPGNDVSALINTGTTAQTKNGALGVNALAVYGNA